MYQNMQDHVKNARANMTDVSAPLANAAVFVLMDVFVTAPQVILMTKLLRYWTWIVLFTGTSDFNS